MITFEDFHVGVTDTFGDYLVTEKEIIEFAEKYDPQPFHTDPEFAAKSYYGKLIASGWMTGAITMRLLCDQILTDSSSMGSPGIDKLRWHRPVFAGDRLKATVIVIEARESKSKPGIGIVTYDVQTLNQNDEVVMSINTTGMFLTRAAVKEQQSTT